MIPPLQSLSISCSSVGLLPTSFPFTSLMMSPTCRRPCLSIKPPWRIRAMTRSSFSTRNVTPWEVGGGGEGCLAFAHSRGLLHSSLPPLQPHTHTHTHTHRHVQNPLTSGSPAFFLIPIMRTASACISALFTAASLLISGGGGTS